ncbi:DUF4400 domain-containing protein [Massilia sp. erpn]|uniref:DUF4400 domain-containing protein n=1 Tax=Massilia sp. erpn TaxID=2738142 RepID=UPI0021027755|nr:DUF4400 domain-containing protein [Massilia sp. erpn]UTY55882.1 DUF4400 domain-containing protein [Massilia sp. erpn]
MAIHPVAIKNSFGSHLALWCLFLPLLSLIFLPLVFPNQPISEAEVWMVASLDINVNALTESANGKFTSLFIDSGIKPKSEALFSSDGVLFAGGLPQRWMNGVWMMIYKALWRTYVLTRIFFLPLLVLVVAAAVDGSGVRARKKYKFEMSNPVFFYSSTHLVVMMCGLFAFLPLAPIPLSSTVLVALLLALGAGVWLSAANFQTGN